MQILYGALEFIVQSFQAKAVMILRVFTFYETSSASKCSNKQQITSKLDLKPIIICKVFLQT